MTAAILLLLAALAVAVAAFGCACWRAYHIQISRNYWRSRAQRAEQLTQTALRQAVAAEADAIRARRLLAQYSPEVSAA